MIYKLADDTLAEWAWVEPIGRSLVDLGMISPSVPEREKDLLINVTEQPRQTLQPYLGVSTADGLRSGIDYYHRNLLGRSASLNLSAQLNRQLFFFLSVLQAEREDF